MSGSIQFTQAERERVQRDILQWRTESEITGGEEFEFDEYLAELQSCSDEDLCNWWWSSVGEWVMSRSDMYDEFLREKESGDNFEEFSEFVEDQFGRVVSGEECAYGYLPGAVIERELV